jgi:hypothetical protein
LRAVSPGNELAADRDQVKAKIAQTLAEPGGLNREQAEAAAEEQMARFSRWQQSFGRTSFGKVKIFNHTVLRDMKPRRLLAIWRTS